MRWGREGLYGRPRPVSFAHLWGNAITPLPGDHLRWMCDDLSSPCRLAILPRYVPATRCIQYGTSVETYQPAAQQPAGSVHSHRAMQCHAPACSGHKRHSKLTVARSIVTPAMLSDGTRRAADQPAPGQCARVDSTTAPAASLMFPPAW